MMDAVLLRCKFCGAPFSREDAESNATLITCGSCGTTQQRLDAKEYIESMMASVKSWISSAIPKGMSASVAENVDPVARHRIFTSEVGPRIERELMEYRFLTTTLFSGGLITLPFNEESVRNELKGPSDAFEFNAKIISAQPLAVDESSKKLIADADAVSRGYAVLANNRNLMGKITDGRFVLMANNFKEAANALKGAEGYEVHKSRLLGLSKLAEGINYLLSGKPGDARTLISEGRVLLKEAETKATGNPALGVMLRGIKQEISVADVGISLADIMIYNPGTESVACLDKLRRIMSVAPTNHRFWGPFFSNKDRYSEILQYFSQAAAAKAGNGTIPIAPGAGNVLMPFWEIDLKYSFTTGGLWKKKSVEVKEDLLLDACFAADPRSLDNPREAMTDIFLVRPKASIVSSLKGDEKSISGGEGIGRLQDMVSDSSPGDRDIIVPLSTLSEAERMVTNYLSLVAQSDDKFKLSKPVVRRVIYVPCEVSGDRIQPVKGMGVLTPKSLGRLSVGNAISI